MWDRVTDVTDPAIPNGYKVTYHEERGYDSPTRWFEVHLGVKMLGEFATKSAAIKAAQDHAKDTEPISAWERLGRE